MVEQIKEALGSVTESVGGEMARRDPFHAVTLVVIVVLLGYFVWMNQKTNDSIIEMRLADQQMESKRQQQREAHADALEELVKVNREDREAFTGMLESMALQERRSFNEGVERVDELLNKIEESRAGIDSKLDMIINNQQIRSVIHSQPTGPTQ